MEDETQDYTHIPSLNSPPSTSSPPPPSIAALHRPSPPPSHPNWRPARVLILGSGGLIGTQLKKVRNQHYGK